MTRLLLALMAVTVILGASACDKDKHDDDGYWTHPGVVPVVPIPQPPVDEPEEPSAPAPIVDDPVEEA